jgi:hypothetical protein
MKHKRIANFVLLLMAMMFDASCRKEISIVDDAGGRHPEDLPEISDDVFAQMDAPLKFDTADPEDAKAIKGRNTWNLWTAGNEQFWDRMARESYGLIDLLKTIDSRKRSTRFKEMGLINQPGMRQATKPDEFGLWIDEVVIPESASIDPEVYGRPTGIMGFRLFRNPDFDEEARKAWNADRYYNDPEYAVNPKLVRPYIVGISCGSCHISHHPLHPPENPENPEWRNLSSTIGNQYIQEGRTFANNVKPGGFFWEMISTQPRGTSDTSRIATDNINNPNAINSIFLLGARESIGHQETSSGETLLLPGEDFDESPELRVLKDGADSVGVVGAILRVYVNIGEYNQHWLRQHNPLVGLTGQKPFSIRMAQKNSIYWRATEQKVPNIAAFFRRVKPYKLADAQGGSAFMPSDQGMLDRGRFIFARNCATCHSSKQPPADIANADDWFEKQSADPEFWKDNFLSDEERYPVTKIKTNSARAGATNAMRGHIWHAFSSEEYKNLPSVGEIDVWNPYSGEYQQFHVQGGGPGYYRTPSLISVWATAPLLHNNALGLYNNDPSVKGRLAAFEDAMEKLLWPEKRTDGDSIWRTGRECQIRLHGAVIPEPLKTILKPHLDSDGYFRIGHIPAGTPVNLLANIDPDANPIEIAKAAIKIKKALAQIKLLNLNPADAKELLKTEVAPALFAISKCPDLVEDRGHYFGRNLPDEDKKALISFMKTL